MQYTDNSSRVIIYSKLERPWNGCLKNKISEK
jgi:hypothetical protein